AERRNYLRFRLGPELSLSMGAAVKKPGAELVAMPVELSAVNMNQGDEMDGYERLLTEALQGDAVLFVRGDEVEAAGAGVQPILGDRTPIFEYQPGSWGPAEADALAADIGGWHNPQGKP